MSTDADLERRIRLGEDSSLEFKAVALAGTKVRGPSRRDFADELAAMANGRGGTIVLGVLIQARPERKFPRGRNAKRP